MNRRQAALLILAAAAIVLLVVAPVGIAAKGGNGGNKGNGGGGNGNNGSGSYSVTVSPNAPYTFGQAIWVTTDAPVYPDNNGPWISLTCYQGPYKVYGMDHAGFEGGWYYNDPFYLGPTMMWQGGDADCTVKVFHTSRSKIVIDATTSFHVDG